MSGGNDELLDPEDVRRQASFLERVKGLTGIQDDFLAALLANQTQLAGIERQQTNLLRQLQSGLTIGDVDLSQSVVKAGITASLNDLLVGAQVVWPGAGDPFSFPSAPTANNRITANLVTGSLDLAGIDSANVRPNLESIGADRALSANLWADADLEIFTFDENNRQTGHFTHDQLTFTRISGISMARAEIQTSQTFTMRAQMSTGLVPPLDTRALAGMQRRQAIQDSTNTLTPVRFAPPGIATSLGLSDSTTKSVLADHGVQTLLTKNVAQGVWIVENADAANDVDVQIRERDIDGEAWVADSDIHGTTETDPTVNANATITVQAGTTDVFETGITTRFKQLRITSTANDSPAEARVQYGGYAPAMR